MNNYYNGRKLVISSLWIVIGVTLWVLSFLEKIPSELWSGIGGGLIAVGILQVVRNIKYRTDSNYKEKLI